MREVIHTALAKTRLKNHYGARYIGTTDDWFCGEIFGMKFCAIDQNSRKQD